MQALYARELAEGEAQHFIDTVLRPHLKNDKASLTFATRLFIRSLDYAEKADEAIAEHVKNWDVSRIALIDRLLLRMAICEFLAFEDIPPKVTINEAIEVAKKYSTPRSGQFINGILDAVLLQLQEEGRLKKSGRGLVGMPSIQSRTTS